MRSITEMVRYYVGKGMTVNQAENYACQKIVLSKISESSLADKVLVKGGVVMFNRTGNLRRATADLDFDFIRYDISETSIRSFIALLNHHRPQFILTIKYMQPLNQEDYKGKRVVVSISDRSAELEFKMDIGVHTLLGIKQDAVCFTFMDGEDGVMLAANPPEQIFAEKAYSLAKHGAFSGRGKDIFDMYYLMKECNLDKALVSKCLELLTFENKRGIGSIDDVRESVEEALRDDSFKRRLSRAREKWVDKDIETIAKAIIDFIYDV
ncbi:MAG: nucleotidyl transferase AbiEii/AbiGii toxin family protein [Bacilli bacterium]|nr:nucleotidyl transferase AbiEii/AbiGii toxin family protein [Bacilli bacterium]